MWQPGASLHKLIGDALQQQRKGLNLAIRRAEIPDYTYSTHDNGQLLAEVLVYMMSKSTGKASWQYINTGEHDAKCTIGFDLEVSHADGNCNNISC